MTDYYNRHNFFEPAIDQCSGDEVIYEYDYGQHDNSDRQTDETPNPDKEYFRKLIEIDRKLKAKIKKAKKAKPVER